MQGLFASLVGLSAPQALEQQHQVVPQAAEQAALVHLFQGHQRVLGQVLAIELQVDGTDHLALLDGGVQGAGQLEVGLQLAGLASYNFV